MPTILRNKTYLVSILVTFIGVILPTSAYVATRLSDPKAGPVTATLSPTVVPTGALGLKWLTFESQEFNFTHKYSKCMRPHDYNPPYEALRGWVYRCDDGKPKMEVLVTRLGLSATLQTYPSSGELEFAKYQNAHYSGWRGLIADEIVYYILERPNEENIWVIGNLDQFDDAESLGYHPADLIQATVDSVAPFK